VGVGVGVYMCVYGLVGGWGWSRCAHGGTSFEEEASEIYSLPTITQINMLVMYGVATCSRFLESIGLFCKRALWKRRYSAKETYHFKEPTNRSHPIAPTCTIRITNQDLKERLPHETPSPLPTPKYCHCAQMRAHKRGHWHTRLKNCPCSPCGSFWLNNLYKKKLYKKIQEKKIEIDLYWRFRCKTNCLEVCQKCNCKNCLILDFQRGGFSFSPSKWKRISVTFRTRLESVLDVWEGCPSNTLAVSRVLARIYSFSRWPYLCHWLSCPHVHTLPSAPRGTPWPVSVLLHRHAGLVDVLAKFPCANTKDTHTPVGKSFKVLNVTR